MAVPILRDDGIVAAIGVVAPAERATRRGKRVRAGSWPIAPRPASRLPSCGAGSLTTGTIAIWH